MRSNHPLRKLHLPYPARHSEREPLTSEPIPAPRGVPMRGLLIACLLAAPFWAALFFLLRWLR